MPVALALASFLLFNSAAQRHEVSRQHMHAGHWTVRVETDHFRQATGCRITGNHMAYASGVVTLSLDHKVDTFDAVYRIDRGNPVKAATKIAELAKQGVAVYHDGLDNPSGGTVSIPSVDLMAAHIVEVETRMGARPVKFMLDGLGSALRLSMMARCSI